MQGCCVRSEELHAYDWAELVLRYLIARLADMPHMQAFGRREAALSRLADGTPACSDSVDLWHALCLCFGMNPDFMVQRTALPVLNMPRAASPESRSVSAVPAEMCCRKNTQGMSEFLK